MAHKSLGIRFGAVAIVLGLVAAACTSTPEALPIASDPAALSYLAVVQATEEDFLASFRSLRNAVGESYATRSVLVKGTQDGDFVQTAEVALATAEAAKPPASLAQDHEAWITYRKTITRINEELLTVALDAADLGAILAVFTKAEQAYGSLLIGTSREFCLVAAIDRDLCEAPDTLVGGEYGELAYETIRVYVLSMFGLLNFPGALMPSERSARLADNQPSIEAALKSARDSFGKICAVGEFTDDHAAFLRFFIDQYATATAITAANAEGNDERLLELFAISRDNADNLVASLSPAYGPIAAPFFTVDFAG